MKNKDIIKLLKKTEVNNKGLNRVKISINNIILQRKNIDYNSNFDDKKSYWC